MIFGRCLISLCSLPISKLKINFLQHLQLNCYLLSSNKLFRFLNNFSALGQFQSNLFLWKLIFDNLARNKTSRIHEKCTTYLFPLVNVLTISSESGEPIISESIQNILKSFLLFPTDLWTSPSFALFNFPFSVSVKVYTHFRRWNIILWIKRGHCVRWLYSLFVSVLLSFSTTSNYPFGFYKLTYKTLNKVQFNLRQRTRTGG